MMMNHFKENKIIKTKVIQTPKGRLLIVDTPEGASNLTYPKVGLRDLYFERQGNHTPEESYLSVEIPYGYWQLLGKLPDITEKQAQNIVGDDPEFAKCWKRYGDKKGMNKTCWTAKESLITLVESEVLLHNPLGEYPTEESTGLKYGMKYLSKVDDWEELQEKVLKSPVLFWEPQNKESSYLI